MTSIYRYQICFSFLFFTKKYRKLIIISCLSDAVNWLLHIVEVGCNICDFVVNPNFVLLAEFSTKLRCSIAFSCRKKNLFISKTLALTNALQEYQYRVSTISSTNEQWNQGIFYLKIFKTIRNILNQILLNQSILNQNQWKINSFVEFVLLKIQPV